MPSHDHEMQGHDVGPKRRGKAYNLTVVLVRYRD